MREIKFRAWTGEYMLTQEELDAYSINELRKGVLCDRPCDGDQARIILMQFTGLRDKNGVEIYEGDVVDVRESAHLHRLHRFVVRWNKIGWHPWIIVSGFREHDYSYLSDPRSIVVIGNIHGNADLLKERTEGE